MEVFREALTLRGLVRLKAEERQGVGEVNGVADARQSISAVVQDAGKMEGGGRVDDPTEQGHRERVQPNDAMGGRLGVGAIFEEVANGCSVVQLHGQHGVAQQGSKIFIRRLDQERVQEGV